MTNMSQAAAHPSPEELNAFVDGERTVVERENIQQHLEGCHQCALRVLSAMQLKGATARAGERFRPSAETLARLTARLDIQSREQNVRAVPVPSVPARSVSWWRGVSWSALAAAVLLAVSLGGWREVHQANLVGGELLDQHLANLSADSAPEVLSSDRHTVKPWFQGRLPFSFNLPEPGALPPETVLRGADLVYVQGRPAALLIFKIRQHDASVFVTQRDSFAMMPRSTRSGFAIRSTDAAEVRLTGVSNVNQSELDALIAALAKVQ
jgi:anti-sigma factor RsiW